MASNYQDAIGYLVRALVRIATGMAANSVRPANQVAPTGDEDDEFATVLIVGDTGDLSGTTRRTDNYSHPAWAVGTAYTAGQKVTYSGAAYVCILAVTGGSGPAVDTAHWSATTQSTQVTETLDVDHEFTASVQFFRHASPSPDDLGIAVSGHAAFDRACRLESLLMLSPNMEQMQKWGLVFRGASPARNLASLVDGATWEDRGSVDLYFGCCTSEAVLLDTIASAGITLKSEWPGGRIVNQTIEVTP